jgi:hypothetical protein
LDPHAAHWVRYGDESDGVHRYHYRLVVAQNDGIPCRDELFDDPDTAHKFCWRAPADYTFTNLAGHWKQLTRCEGCSKITYSYSLGVSFGEENSVSTSWSSTVTTTMSAGFEFEGIGVGSEISAEVSEEVTAGTAHSYSMDKQSALTIECENGAMYQWWTSGNQFNGIDGMSFSVETSDFACIDASLEPQCLPGFQRTADYQRPCKYDCDTDYDCEAGLVCNAHYCREPTSAHSVVLSVVPNSESATSLSQLTAADWYHAHYSELVVFLASLLAILCGLTLCAMVRSRGSKNKAYAAVKYMESDTEMDVEAKPIAM